MSPFRFRSCSERKTACCPIDLDGRRKLGTSQLPIGLHRLQGEIGPRPLGILQPNATPGQRAFEVRAVLADGCIFEAGFLQQADPAQLGQMTIVEMRAAATPVGRIDQAFVHVVAHRPFGDPAQLRKFAGGMAVCGDPRHGTNDMNSRLSIY